MRRTGTVRTHVPCVRALCVRVVAPRAQHLCAPAVPPTSELWRPPHARKMPPRAHTRPFPHNHVRSATLSLSPSLYLSLSRARTPRHRDAYGGARALLQSGLSTPCARGGDAALSGGAALARASGSPVAQAVCRNTSHAWAARNVRSCAITAAGCSRSTNGARSISSVVPTIVDVSCTQRLPLTLHVLYAMSFASCQLDTHAVLHHSRPMCSYELPPLHRRLPSVGPLKQKAGLA